MLNFDGKASSFFAVIDGHGENGEQVAHIVEVYLSSKDFTQQLLEIGNQHSLSFDAKTLLYKDYIFQKFRKIDASLNLKMANSGGVSIACFFVDNQKIVVSVGHAEANVIGVKNNSYDVVFLNNQFRLTDNVSNELL